MAPSQEPVTIYQQDELLTQLEQLSDDEKAIILEIFFPSKTVAPCTVSALAEDKSFLIQRNAIRPPPGLCPLGSTNAFHGIEPSKIKVSSLWLSPDAGPLSAPLKDHTDESSGGSTCASLGDGHSQSSTSVADLEDLQDLPERPSGLNGCSTVMVKDIPSSYTQRKLLHEIDLAGYAGLYDYFYLPVDTRLHAHRGFAYVNFVSYESADRFYHQFHEKTLEPQDSSPCVRIEPAAVQGFEANAIHYCTKMRNNKHARAIFYKPLPAHCHFGKNAKLASDLLKGKKQRPAHKH